MVLGYPRGPPKQRPFFVCSHKRDSAEAESERFRAWEGSVPGCWPGGVEVHLLPGRGLRELRLAPADSQQGNGDLNPAVTAGFCQHP